MTSRDRRLAAVLLALAALAPGRPGLADPQVELVRRPRTSFPDESLRAGGFCTERGIAGPRTARPSSREPASLLLRRLDAVAARPAGFGPVVVPGRGPSPQARGDRLLVALDDDIEAPVDMTFEARLDVSGGLAGPLDVVAVRFPSRALASSPPFRLTDAVVGFDDLHGATTWPRIALALEDPARPLTPGAGVEVLGFDPGLAPAPAEALAPTAFVRARVGLPDLDVPDDWISDGAHDDDFSGAAGPLDDLLTSDWREYAGGLRSNSGLDVAGGEVVRTSPAAATLAIKIPSADVEAMRPAVDLDVEASVTLDVGAAGSQLLGLALRAVAPDAYYRVELDEASATLRVHAVTPGGSIPIGPALGPIALAGTSVPLTVRVTGTNPVRFVVTAQGTSFPVIADATYLYAGGYYGLSASSGGTTGEAWDDFQVRRRRDAFVLIEFPPGQDAGLPLDVSQDSLVVAALDPAIPPAGSVLLSADGVDFVPRPSAVGCENPGNPFVQLEVEEITDLGLLFDYEAHVVELAVGCAACPTARNECVENEAEAERWMPVFTEGETHSVSVSWWPEHLLDDPALSFRGSLWDAPCDVPGTEIAFGTAVVGADPGQLGASAALRSTPVFDFVGPAPGSYCVVVEELHGAPAFDSNPTTSVVVRDVEVASTCTPLAVANLVGSSLRVTRPPADPDVTTLSWQVTGFPGRFNVHAMEARALDRDTCFHEAAPIVDRVVGATQRTYDWPAPPGGRALWMAVFEQDGCPSANSIPDDSLDDPNLPCWP